MYRIGQRYSFSASRILEGLPDEHPCSRLHGHTFTVDIELARATLDERGFVLDRIDLAEFEHIVRGLDHQHLNDLFPFTPTAELLAVWLHTAAVNVYGNVVKAVRVAESESSWAEFRPA